VCRRWIRSTGSAYNPGHAYDFGLPRVLDGLAALIDNRRGEPSPTQPVVILTRLGEDLSCQGLGLGKALALDALRRVAVASEVTAATAVRRRQSPPPVRR
jgi:hypothetical protein